MAVHSASLVRPFDIAGDVIVGENRLHLIGCVGPSLASLDAEVFVEERAMGPFEDAARLQPLIHGGTGPIVPLYCAALAVPASIAAANRLRILRPPAI